MTTIQDYRNAINEMNGQEINSEEWKKAEINLNKIANQGLEEGNRRIAMEIKDGLDTLYELLVTWNGDKTEIQNQIALEDSRLRRYGFSDLADRAKEFWEE